MTDFEQRVAHLSPAKRELLRRLAGEKRAQSSRIKRRDRPARIPLTFGQRRLWFLDRMSPGVPAYNVPAALWLRGPLDRHHLRSVVQALLDRYETLRTRFAHHDGEPWQEIVEGVTVPWRELTATGQGEEAVSCALELMRAEIARPFDLERDAMIRAALIRVSDDLHLFVLSWHHIAIDGTSRNALLAELQKNYNRLCAGEGPDTVAPDLQLADYALWQHETFGGEGLDTQLAYWHDTLDAAPAVIDWPSDRPRLPYPSGNGAVLRVAVPPGIAAAVEAFAKATTSTPSMLYLAAYQAVIGRYTGKQDVVVSMGSAGRGRAELEPLVGFLVNTVPVRARWERTTSFRALLESCRESVLGALHHADAPLDRILDVARASRSAGVAAFAQAMFFYQSYPRAHLAMTGLEVENLSDACLSTGTAKADLSLLMDASELVFEYSTDLFDADRIERMGGHLLTLLAAGIERPETPVSRLPLLTQDETSQLTRWNSTQRPLPTPATIEILVSRQVAATPAATAIRFGTRAISYDELDRRSDVLAEELRGHGVRGGVLVGLYVDRTPEMVVGLLGILKAGGAYVPMDPAYPKERLDYMLEVSLAGVVVTQAGLAHNFASGVAAVVVDAASELPHTRLHPPAYDATPDDPAYVIFTSGSTGRPKGVEISRRSAVNLLQSVARAPGVTGTDRVCAISTLSFDIALFELVLPLTVGATILLIDRDTARDGRALRRRIESDAPTVIQATPATWRMLLEAGWRGGPALRLISTGEALPRELAKRLAPCGGELWNLYGPTETTVYSALTRVDAGDGPVLVGRPVDNTQIHIVDLELQLVPVGIPGELLIGGLGLATAYRGRPDLTAEKFIPDTLGGTPGQRLYRTGDLASWRPDGTIEVVGRIDHQIKLRGFRIELGEIETVLSRHPAVSQAVVYCREDQPGDRRLVAYVTTRADTSADALREHLQAALPDYMVPSAYVMLEQFALTPNGKVDRKALPPPLSVATGSSEIMHPRTPEEQELCMLWRQVLNLEHVGPRSNFFDLGGHSLLATQLLSRIAQTFAVDLPLRALFESPTLEGLAARVAAERDLMPLGDLDALLTELEGLSDDDARRLTSGERA